jgi:phasin family protein
MNKLIDQISTTGKSNMDAALKLAKLSAEAANQLLRLQMEAARTFMAEQSASVKNLASPGDSKGMTAAPGKVAEKAVESAVGFSRNVYEIAAHTQHEIAAVMEERFNAMREDMQKVMEEMAKQVPGGAEPAVNALKAAFASSQNAFDALSKAAKQGADAAETNLKSALSGVAAATKKK